LKLALTGASAVAALYEDVERHRSMWERLELVALPDQIVPMSAQASREPHATVVKLREIFGTDRYSITVQPEVTKNLKFNLKQGEQGGEDAIQYVSITESDSEWIAVARNSDKTIYDLFERSTFFNGSTLRMAIHPLTRAPVKTDMIIQGKALLDLLAGA